MDKWFGGGWSLVGSFLICRRGSGLFAVGLVCHRDCARCGFGISLRGFFFFFFVVMAFAFSLDLPQTHDGGVGFDLG